MNRLIEKVPRDHEANWLMVRCLKNLGRIDDAVGRLEMLAKIAPSDEKVWLEMGMIYLNEKGEMDTAREMFARSLSLNPDQPELTFLIGQLQYPQQSRPQMPGFTPAMPGAELPSLPDVRPLLPQIPAQPWRRRKRRESPSTEVSVPVFLVLEKAFEPQRTPRCDEDGF